MQIGRKNCYALHGKIRFGLGEIKMDLLFLGTGAADWCADDKKRADYRRFSSLLINDDLMIDPGPHIFDFETDFKLSNLYDNAENILLTHSHADHLSGESLSKLCSERKRIIFTENHAAAAITARENLYIKTVGEFSPFTVGRYTVTALPANHKTPIAAERPFHYIIECGDKRIFYGIDGAWFMQETWWHLEKFTFDAVILDGTLGDTSGDTRIFGHNNLPMIEILSDAFKGGKMLKTGAQLIITHLARDTHKPPAELAKRLEPFGITAAYDGMKISV